MAPYQSHRYPCVSFEMIGPWHEIHSNSALIVYTSIASEVGSDFSRAWKARLEHWNNSRRLQGNAGHQWNTGGWWYPQSLTVMRYISDTAGYRLKRWRSVIETQSTLWHGCLYITYMQLTGIKYHASHTLFSHYMYYLSLTGGECCCCVEKH